MPRFTTLLISWTIAALLPVAMAEQVYRSVDADGGITFSDRPSDRAVVNEAVELPPPPSEEAVQAARERAEQTIERSEQLAKEREALEKTRAEAKREQQAAQASQPDWGAYPYPPPDWYDNYPSRPVYPIYPRRPRPRYPGEWTGPGDHPAFRPGWPRPWKPHPGPRPMPLEEPPTQRVLPNG